MGSGRGGGRGSRSLCLLPWTSVAPGCGRRRRVDRESNGDGTVPVLLDGGHAGLLRPGLLQGLSETQRGLMRSRKRLLVRCGAKEQDPPMDRHSSGPRTAFPSLPDHLRLRRRSREDRRHPTGDPVRREHDMLRLRRDGAEEPDPDRGGQGREGDIASAAGRGDLRPSESSYGTAGRGDDEGGVPVHDSCGRRKTMKVEVLYFEGGPNHIPTVEMVGGVLKREGIDAEVAAIEVPHIETAQALRFLGSPSVRVDGADIEPGREKDPPVFGCRTYSVR